MILLHPFYTFILLNYFHILGFVVTFEQKKSNIGRKLRCFPNGINAEVISYRTNCVVICEKHVQFFWFLLEHRLNHVQRRRSPEFSLLPTELYSVPVDIVAPSLYLFAFSRKSFVWLVVESLNLLILLNNTAFFNCKVIFWFIVFI